jgi:hypothetical protein
MTLLGPTRAARHTPRSDEGVGFAVKLVVVSISVPSRCRRQALPAGVVSDALPGRGIGYSADLPDITPGNPSHPDRYAARVIERYNVRDLQQAGRTRRTRRACHPATRIRRHPLPAPRRRLPPRAGRPIRNLGHRVPPAVTVVGQPPFSSVPPHRAAVSPAPAARGRRSSSSAPSACNAVNLRWPRRSAAPREDCNFNGVTSVTEGNTR